MRTAAAGSVLLVLPACAGGFIAAVWAGSMLVLSLAVFALSRLSRALQAHDHERLLRQVCQGLGLPNPPAGGRTLTWTSRRGLRLDLSAGPHLELRAALPAWVPHDLVIDSVAPPMRGLRRLVPDPRLMEWVAAGDAPQVLSLMAGPVRDALLTAQDALPGPGVCIRRGGLEAGLSWGDLDALDRLLAHLDRIAECIEVLPESLVERLWRGVCSSDGEQIRRGCLRTLEDHFPGHPLTTQAQAYAWSQGLGAQLRDAGGMQGRLTLCPPGGGGQLGLASTQGSRPKTSLSSSRGPISAS